MDHFENPRSTHARFDHAVVRLHRSRLPCHDGLPETRSTPPAVQARRRNLQGTLRPLPRREGRRQGHDPIYLDPAPRDLTKAAFMITKPEDRFLHVASRRRARNVDAAWGKVLTDEQIDGVLDYVSRRLRAASRAPLKAHKVPEQNPVASSRGIHRAAARRSSCSAAPAATAARPTARARIPSTSARARATCAIRFRQQRCRPAPVRLHPLRRAGHGHAVMDRLRPHAERRRRSRQLHSQSESADGSSTDPRRRVTSQMTRRTSNGSTNRQ